MDKKIRDNIFVNEVEPATELDDKKIDEQMIDLSEVEESDEEAQG